MQTRHLKRTVDLHAVCAVLQLAGIPDESACMFGSPRNCYHLSYIQGSHYISTEPL